MPIYEYGCDSCHREIEVIQKAGDNALVECPQCSEPSLRKRTSLSSFQLKGGGWYKDGYGTSNSKSPSKHSAEATAA